MKKQKDEKTGAIFFAPEGEDLEMINMKTDIKKMKKEILELKNIITEIKHSL
jgi:late competence protein required for DNA uptake (superfamily II DNA/RNA helicase)